ncbi:helix-turn-helix domain-containing protein [Aliarcobacter butzleri]|uniref:helix-turn-helix domain-containing protein n=1 Tax=Aliarcobacter butzleri TaxID=28197 RepID=UPI001EDBA51D|nr:helix-turn-helix transcriptional regulator [Aliarcobacter butzleri]MCG3667778.1 helix-turn-helix domain-containing protein [Aliarcobacter butzleri]
MKKSKLSKESFTKLLKENNINQKELAEILGIAEVTVNKWFVKTKMPLWVENYLEIYNEANKYKNILLKLKETNEILKTIF